jgi:hypothetical protein
MDGYVTKPLSRKELQIAIESLIGMHEEIHAEPDVPNLVN